MSLLIILFCLLLQEMLLSAEDISLWNDAQTQDIIKDQNQTSANSDLNVNEEVLSKTNVPASKPEVFNILYFII